jgi:hypothetical protein
MSHPVADFEIGCKDHESQDFFSSLFGWKWMTGKRVSRARTKARPQAS